MLAPAVNAHTHDVYFYAGKCRFSYLRMPNRGVMLDDDGVSWRADERTVQMPYSDIVVVHLDTASAADKVSRRCIVEFADAMALCAANGPAMGRPEQMAGQPYRDFVRDLHRRLVARPHQAIRFTSGMGRTGMGRVGLAVLLVFVIIGFLFDGAIVMMAAVNRDLNSLYIALCGLLVFVVVAAFLRRIRPRRYLPDNVPEEQLL
jgi:hypothetical protein